MYLIYYSFLPPAVFVGTNIKTGWLRTGFLLNGHLDKIFDSKNTVGDAGQYLSGEADTLGFSKV
jgi:hypothetical protein